MSPPARSAPFAASARVLAVEADGRPRVQVLDGGCPILVADWAIPFRYEPQPGDLLRVLGKGDRCWVTGVAHGHGRSTMAFRGDVALHSHGALRLGGDGGVRIEAPAIHAESAQTETTAETIVQHFGEHDQAVQGLVDERAGASERVIDGDDSHRAGRHETRAAAVVKLDGNLLRLS